MFAGLSAALGAGLLWGLVFLPPLVLHDYPGFMLAVGRYLAALRASGVPVATGSFGAVMEVELVNDGPATFHWRTKRRDVV